MTTLDVVYLLARYPVASEQFVQRELRVLQERDVALRVVALEPDGADERVPAEAGAPRVPVWRPPPWRSLALWRSACGEARRAPRAAACALALAWKLARGDGASGLAAARALRDAAVALAIAAQLRPAPPQLIHAHFATRPTAIAMLVADQLAVPFGFSAHAHDVYASRVALELRVARAAHVLACSDTLADDLRGRLPASQHARVQRLHHGLDLSLWRASAAVRADPPLLLAAGRFEAKKGFECLIEACTQLRERGVAFRCEILGAGREAERLAAAIERRDLGGCVSLAAWCAPEALRARFADAALLAVPSVIAPDRDRDNLPNVMLEALASELPVVATRLPAIERLLAADDVAPLVAPNDAAALADAIASTLANPALARERSRRGRALVEARFDAQRNGSELLAILHRSAEAATRGAGPQAP